MSFRRWVGVAALILALVGCSREEPSPLVGAAIPNDVSGEIDALRERIVASFAAPDPTVLRGLLVEELAREIDAGPGYDATFGQLRQAITERPLSPLVALYDPRPNPGGERRELVTDPDHGFVVTLDAKGERAYVALLEQPGEPRDRVFGLVFVDRGQGWRVNALRAGTLRVARRSAQDWYAEAVELQGQGKLLPAVNRTSFAAGLLRPLPFVRFVKEAEFLALQNELQAALQRQHTFPLELSELPTRPRVYRIAPLLVEGGKLSQTVQYVSTLPLSEGPLKSEVELMAPALAQRFPGFCHGIDRVAYLALSAPPTAGGSPGPSVGVVGSCTVQ